MRAAAALVTLLLIAPQNGYDLFQKALVKERAEGKIDEAIQIYEQIIREFSADRALVTKAQEAAKAARTRLSGLNLKSDRESSIVTRRLLTGAADFLGGVSLDGRYISTVDWDGDGNVVLIDIALVDFSGLGGPCSRSIRGQLTWPIRSRPPVENAKTNAVVSQNRSAPPLRKMLLLPPKLATD